MYKKAIITDEISQDFEIATQLCVRHGLDGVELRSVWNTPPHALTKQQISEVRKICEANGLSVCALSAPCFKCELGNDTPYGEQLEIIRRTIECSDEFGLRYIRGFSFWKDERTLDSVLERIAERYQKAVELVKGAGKVIVIEQDPSTFASNAAGVAKIISAIGSDSVRALWDGGNDVYDPEGEQSFPDGYDIIKKYISHIHIKDAVKTPEGTVGVCPGKGEARVWEFLHALKSDCYDGWVVAEPHFRVDGVIDEKLLRTPGGAAFSAEGYLPSDIFLSAWDEFEKNDRLQ